ncbi:MAG: ATPase, T2SS/T4P/T4SS family [Pseudomonadota bacterium]
MTTSPSLTGELTTSPASSAFQYRLLLVDDDERLLAALKRVLRQKNYDIVTCEDPKQALELLKKEAFHLIISDYLMPVMNGGEFLKQACSIQPNSMRMLLTANGDVNAVMNAVKAGAVYKFILKPWNDDEVRLNVSLALEKHDLIAKNAALEREKHKNTQEIEQLAKFSASNRNQLAFMLNKKGLLSNDNIRELLSLQSQRKDAVAIKLIVECKWVSEEVIHHMIGEELMFKAINLKEYSVDHSVAALIPAIMCQRQLVVPLNIHNKRLTLAMADPLDTGLIENIRFVTGLEVVPELASINAIEAKIAEIYQLSDSNNIHSKEAPPHYTHEGNEIVIEDDNLPLHDALQGDELPAIRFVNLIILEATRLNASEIHIQPYAQNVAVRLRVEGILFEKFQISHAIHQSIVSRIKIMGELDISEETRPQNARINIKTPTRAISLQISTLPTINGEKVVLRVFDRHYYVLPLNALGFDSAAELEKTYVLSNRRQGVILTAGPVDCGKTTTLYSLLHHSKTSEKNYITIENLNEYYVESAGQVLVKEKIGLTFPIMLRSAIQQNPDVVLLSEINDKETAEIAFQAALKGYQIYSSLPTHSVFATLAFLLDLGIKPFLIANALEGIIAQRLVRRVCEHCSQAITPDSILLHYFNWEITSARQGAGCQACNYSGYKGQVGIYEVLLLDETMRQMLPEHNAISSIKHYAHNQGFTSLQENALNKVKDGITTLEEAFRVLGSS